MPQKDSDNPKMSEISSEFPGTFKNYSKPMRMTLEFLRTRRTSENASEPFKTTQIPYECIRMPHYSPEFQRNNQNLQEPFRTTQNICKHLRKLPNTSLKVRVRVKTFRNLSENTRTPQNSPERYRSPQNL